MRLLILFIRYCTSLGWKVMGRRVCRPTGALFPRRPRKYEKKGFDRPAVLVCLLLVLAVVARCLLLLVACCCCRSSLVGGRERDESEGEGTRNISAAVSRERAPPACCWFEDRAVVAASALGGGGAEQNGGRIVGRGHKEAPKLCFYWYLVSSERGIWSEAPSLNDTTMDAAVATSTTAAAHPFAGEQTLGPQQQQTIEGRGTPGAAGGADPALPLFLVQRCWLDGPNVEPPLDCPLLFASRDEATQFAHASADRYALASAAASPRPRPPGAVRTLLLENSQYGFATSGRLFWVRAVRVPLCPCLRQPQHNHPVAEPAGAAAPAATALARLYRGVVGGTAAGDGGGNLGRRRGTEDNVGSVRLDCPRRCLQGWLSQQLRSHQSCAWRRIPVVAAAAGASGEHGGAAAAGGRRDRWWKEWDDWEMWGGGGGAAAAAGDVPPSAPGRASHKRQLSWDDEPMADDDDEDAPMQGEPPSLALPDLRRTGSAASSSSAFLASGPPGSVAEMNHVLSSSSSSSSSSSLSPSPSPWFSPSTVDYAPNKRTFAAPAAASFPRGPPWQ
jgi:hypothetical protein